MPEPNKDFSSVSPSAAFLVQLKAYTTIPFAKEAAEILEKEDPAMARYIRQAGIKEFFKWMIHFENRYRIIEKIISRIEGKNFLELSSGYSFRGLDMCLNKDVHFIDTDLPDLVAMKQKMVKVISTQYSLSLKGKLDLMALNVLDEKNFKDIINNFNTGPITIINEGLLMYLDLEEKKKACSIIYDILKQRGGQWVTADIYVRKKNKEDDILDSNEEAKKFKEQHHIEENKFENFESAASFFKNCGFKIITKEKNAIEALSCLQLLQQPKRDEVIEKLRNKAHDYEAWCLAAE